MKNLLFFILISSLFYVVSCNSASTDGKNNDCSKSNLNGKCSSGKTCLAGACFDNSELCSEENSSGLCETGYVCYEGNCEETGTLPCSINYQHGICTNQNNICLNGVCINKSEVCSETNLLGKCETGKTCIDGECIDNDACSPENPNGKCLEEETCINGVCKSNVELCSADNLNGICLGDKICNSGVCVDKKCEENQKRNCYPGSESQINKGICREGIQLCKNGEWNECVGAITPQEEVCDYLDNDCDGIVDEDVKNICGDCREEADLPTEIIGNNIDDDCDGKIDEDENNPGGMESCDGRMHQPCYKGPIGTGGVGICKGGFRDCTWDTTLNDWTIWGECVGMILPTAEICGNNIDDNCDGIVDENCQTRECLDEEICGNNIDDNCDDYIDENCSYDVVREECLDEEICNNGFDDNCDGNIDENCSCGELTELDCFASDPSMLNHGETSQCKKGVMYCVGGENWGSCQNQVLPSVELCDGIDNDCDGIIDNNAIDGNLCGGCDGEVLVEICGNNIDDNCDGIIDENCPSSNCVNPTVEICDGVDNDCDGFIDEGVLNSCGKCDDSCYEIVIGNDNTNTCIEGSDNYPNCLNNINDDFNDGELDGIGVDPDDPTKLTLDSSTIENDYIWIANSADDTVTKINTKTRLVEGTFPVGDNPSRTAVERDGSVWVANRDSHNVTKLNADGTFAFNVDLNVNCAPRGVAIDRNGNAWIGCYALRGTMGLSDGDVYKVSPSGTIFTGYPYATGVPIYGLAIDSRGYLWSSRLSDAYAGTAARTVLKIDTNKNPGEFGFFKAFSFNDNFQSYGIVVGQNDHVWYAGWNDSGIKELIYDENTDSVTVITHPFTGGGAGRGIATDSEGNIWCAFSTTDRVGKFDSSGNQLGDYPSKGSAPIGIGVDSEDQVWVINNASSSGQAVELNQDGVERGRQNTGTAPYSYSDLTGFNLRNIVSPSGSFKTIIDTQRTDAIYDSISWIGSTPNGSTIKIRARVSNNRNYFLLDDTDVNSPEWSNFVLVSGQPLTWPSGNKPSGRYIQIEVVMTIGATNEDKPSLSNINVNWQRP